MNKTRIEKAYQLAKEEYAELGVNTDVVLQKMNDVVISLHCWQTDDVGGFRNSGCHTFRRRNPDYRKLPGKGTLHRTNARRPRKSAFTASGQTAAKPSCHLRRFSTANSLTATRLK
jgi:hypothetical protein